MHLFGYTLRRPWVKYVNLEIDVESEVFNAIKKSMAADLVEYILTNSMCDEECDAINYLKRIVKP